MTPEEAQSRCGYTLDAYEVNRMCSPRREDGYNARLEERDEAGPRFGVEYSCSKRRVVCPVCGECQTVNGVDMGVIGVVGVGCDPAAHKAYYDALDTDPRKRR